MTRKNRKRLVIDTNIARSAGMAPIAASLYSRKCLETIRLDEHVVVFSIRLRQEWRKHASLLAKKWQVAMQQRGRIENVEGAEFAGLMERACDCLAAVATKDALRKDFHLVQSALASGQILLSNENRLPGHLALSCAAVPELLRLYFSNPEMEQDECIDWIKAGAKKDAKHRVDRFSRS